MKKDPTYHGIENVHCPACQSSITICTSSVRPEEIEYAEPTFLESLRFNPEQLPGWSLLLIFHGRQEQTGIIQIRVCTNGVEIYPPRRRRYTQDKLTLLLRSVTFIEPTEHSPNVDRFSRVIGVIPTPSGSKNDVVPEIRTNRFLVVGGGFYHNGSHILPMPLVHIIL